MMAIAKFIEQGENYVKSLQKTEKRSSDNQIIQNIKAKMDVDKARIITTPKTESGLADPSGPEKRTIGLLPRVYNQTLLG